MATHAITPDTAEPFGAPNARAASRHLGLDLLRVLAIYMVVQIHTGEFYYIGPVGNVLNTPAAHWVGWLNSLFRVCVPLFVTISGWFLFPVGDERVFFRKRFSRVLVPFVIWCAVYAFYFYARGQTTLHGALLDILKIPGNFGTAVGPLWFVSMLVGRYLFAPVLSPWVMTASRRGMESFLTLWVLASSLAYTHLVFPSVWGEAYWDASPTLYYFTGFIGYVVMGAYLRRFHSGRTSALTKVVAVLLIAAGYAVTAGGFLHRLSTQHMVRNLELTWEFTTINVVMMTAGLMLLLEDLQPAQPQGAPWTLVRDLSKQSYGIYLAHIIVLNAVHGFVDPRVDVTPVKMILIALTTFAITYVLVKLLSLLPGSKWVVG